MRCIEGEDPGRRLAGLENRLKDRYRVEEKVNHDIEKRGVTAAGAFAAMKDAIRSAHCYRTSGTLMASRPMLNGSSQRASNS
jgi:hypothetical protein